MEDRRRLTSEELQPRDPHRHGQAGCRLAAHGHPLVTDTRSAYLARIAFGHVGEDHYRVFYNDLGAAMKWLESSAG